MVEIGNDIKAEKKFKVNLLGVVEEVKERPPARDADLVHSKKPKKIVNAIPTDSSGKEKIAYHEKVIGDSGNRKQYTYDKNNTGTDGTTKTNRKTKTKGNNKEVKQYGIYTSALVVLAFVFFITLFDIGENNKNVSEVLPQPDEVVLNTTQGTVIDFTINIVTGMFKIIINIITFFWNILVSILGLN